MRKLLCLLLLLSIPAAAATRPEVRQPNADYRSRRVAVSEKTKGGVVVLFAATEEEGQNATNGFRQDNYFYYLTGWDQPGAALVIAPAAPAKHDHPARAYEEILFLPAHNLSQERWTGPKLGPENPEAKRITGFDRVELLDKLRDELVRILPSPRSTVYSDLPDYGSTSPSAAPLQWLGRANAFPNYNSLRDVKPLLDEMRLVKDPGEMARIQYATSASVAAHLAAIKAMKPGMEEQQIAWLMQFTYGEQGCERGAYAPVVGAGFNSTVLHYDAGHNAIKDGDLVVMDVAGEYAMYASDITRTVPANGHFTPRQREIYNIVLGAQQAVIDAFQSGKYVINPQADNSIYKVAYDYINTHGKDLHGQSLGKYFIHGLSHYVGLEVHDTGSTSSLLGPGMVFTVEPGIYIPEEKLGVRIEDIFWVDPSGKLVMLSQGLPRTTEEVERAMAKSK